MDSVQDYEQNKEVWKIERKILRYIKKVTFELYYIIHYPWFHLSVNHIFKIRLDRPNPTQLTDVIDVHGAGRQRSLKEQLAKEGEQKPKKIFEE